MPLTVAVAAVLGAVTPLLPQPTGMNNSNGTRKRASSERRTDAVGRDGIIGFLLLDWKRAGWPARASGLNDHHRQAGTRMPRRAAATVPQPCWSASQCCRS